MIQIMRKPGWTLNSNDKIVNAILTRCEKNSGICPCKHEDTSLDLHCPCESYILQDICICGLYIKE